MYESLFVQTHRILYRFIVVYHRIFHHQMAASPTPFGNNRLFSSLLEFQEANCSPIIDCMKTRLLSIEEAVTFVPEFVADVDSYAATAEASCRKNSILTINESAAIYLYTTMKPFYAELNEGLRIQNASTLNPWFPFLRLLLTALKQLPSFSAILWRGVGNTIGDEFAESIVHTWSSVNSCSSCVIVTGCFSGQMGTLFCIRAIRGKDITAYSANQSEKEIVLLPETRLRVKSALFDSHGRSVVNLEEW
jgi:NAD:arginine ADP-ribosyltransferase